MAEKRPNEDYRGIRIASDENLAVRFPQVAVRARLYRLADDGASDRARRRRAAKDSAANSRYAIEAIRKRQTGESRFPPLDPETAARLIEGHRRRIEDYENGSRPNGPDPQIIAPVARRVAREDRRRRKTSGA